MEAGEYEEMTKAAGGVKPQASKDLVCNYLQDGRCSIYGDRPAVFRVWGVAENLVCPYGCEVERKLSPAEALRIFERVHNLCGDGRPRMNVNQADWRRDMALGKSRVEKAFRQRNC